MTTEFTHLGKSGAKTRQLQFSCHNCGSAIEYKIGSNQLTCKLCGYSKTINESSDRIREYKLSEALDNIKLKPLMVTDQRVKCTNCGAESEWDIYSLSDLCPYCKTPIAKLDTDNQRIQIEAILPFDVDKSEAFAALVQWIKGRWFAPNVLKDMAGHSKQLEGIYIPHWTFDSLTETHYRGMRGEHYIEYVRQQRMVNGKMQTVSLPVTKTRWFPASGTVRVIFDDVLVLASMLIPKTIVNQLRPWQLAQAKPYTPDYIAGLKAQYYQLDLDDAFVIAQQRMAGKIDMAIRSDIGGDAQRIDDKETRYQNSTYKLVLLPVWYSSFEYRGKIYRTVMNGQTGKVAGQYPKSTVKIVFAVVIVIILLLVLGYFYG
ncbi:MAG: primosomal protein N' (replication factor Y) - superfamily II helicase [Gammaproteobacteria bacterium]|nr:MAG: primosomal protein N' (replication factor Y) - superfamily II helicase [Gammaproteobacteria bacterium]